MTETEKTMAVRINADLYKKFRVAAVSDGITVKKIIEDALKAYITDFENRHSQK